MNTFIKRPHREEEFTAENIRELAFCAQDPIYFIEKYVKVQHPKRGQVPFILYPYQRKLIEHIHKNRFSVILTSRQAGKTQTVSMYLLWGAAFKKDQINLIASKNNNHAMEIMDRIRYAYEELPMWLKPGCTYYNKHLIEFDNSSIIKSEATTDKTGRGSSISNLYLDELAFINPRIQELMWASVTPTLATGGNCIVSSTPNGDTELYAQLWRGANSGTNEFAPFESKWDEHPERDEEFKRQMIGVIGELRWRQEFENEFLSADSLLINSMVLQQLRATQPDFTSNGFSFWGKLNPNNSYYVGVDISSGIGSDYSVIQVLEFPSLNQFAEFRSNNVSPNGLYLKLRWILGYLSDPQNCETFVAEVPVFRKNDRLFSMKQTDHNEHLTRPNVRPEVYWSFENNGLGQAFISLNQNDEDFPEHPNLVTGPNQVMGVNTSSKTKLMAGLELKRLLEKTSTNLKLNSATLIFELKNLISNNKGTFHAKPGATDDCVSALLVIMQMFKHAASDNEKLYELVYDYNEDSDAMFGDEADYEPPGVLL